ncbi:MAG TPA: sugar phosphate isomerase/epimerase [Vicinamibacterales bacterium]|nr:sugar phosphate isomerase/epimerase [Vicinamibacterales bacterium]
MDSSICDSGRAVPIYVSTACLTGQEPLDRRLERFEEHGLDHVELGGGVVCDGKMLDRLAASSRSFLVHNYFPHPAVPFVLNLASGDEQIRRRSMQFAMEALELCARLGAPFYSVHGGFITDPTGREGAGFAFPAPASADAGRRASERFGTAVEAVLARAQTLGVGLLIENNVCRAALRGRLLCATSDDCVSLVAKRAEGGLGLLVDTGHLNVTARTYGFDRLAFLEAVEPYVGAFHVHDNDGTADMHEPCRPTSWVIGALQRHRRRGVPVVLESKFDSIEALRSHADWLATQLVARD